MSSRIAGAGVLLAAFIAGLAFDGVFAVTALVVPLVAVLMPVAGMDLLVLRHERLAAVRAPAGFLVGAVTGRRAVVARSPMGRAGSGRARRCAPRLERGPAVPTFPAHPDPQVVAFVPLLALLAGVMGVEWLRRGLPPLVTVLPSAAVVGLAQVFHAATGARAIVLALSYGVAVALVLAAGRRAATARFSGRSAFDLVALVLPVVLVAALGGSGRWRRPTPCTPRRTPSTTATSWQTCPRAL